MISNGADKALLGPQITNHFAFLESELPSATGSPAPSFTAADIQMSFPIEAADARVGFAGRLPKLGLRRAHPGAAGLQARAGTRRAADLPEVSSIVLGPIEF